MPLLAGAAGALLTVGVLALTGTFDRSSPSDGSARLAGDVATTVGTPSPADALTRLSPSVVAVFARDAHGSRRGSGVCVRHGAQLLTSARVVGDATSVRVVTADGRNTPRPSSAATASPTSCCSTCRTTRTSRPRNSPTIPRRPGAPVWLLGAASPGTKSPWMSSGMASSSDALVVSDAGPTTSGLLETDAASNTSVVGGALVDASGSVAGIVLGHVNGSATTYAVSIDVAVGHRASARRHRCREARVVGDRRRRHRLRADDRQDEDHGPAADAGMRVNDLVQSVNGRAVESIGDVTALVQGLEPGHTVAIGVRRGTT